MALNINEVKYALSGGGYRPNHFRVFLNNPVNQGSVSTAPFLVKASGLPEMTLGQATAMYFGRPVFFAGDRQISTWSVTVLNDTDFVIRHGMEEWNNAMNLMEGNSTDLLPADYKVDSKIQALNSNGEILREYTFSGIFPIRLGAIRTSWDVTNEISEFDIDFSVDSWAPTNGVTGTYAVE